MLRRIRIPVQLACLGIFLYLLARTLGVGEDRLGPPVRIFLEIDPLVGLTTWIRTGALHGLLPLSGLTLLAAFVLGRSFCGWVCPLGTLSQIAGRLGRPRAQERSPDRSRRSQIWKYALFLFVLGGAATGALWTGILDPICLLIRSLSVGFVPPLETVVREAAEALASTPFSGASEPVYRWIRDHTLAPRPPHFQQGTLLAFLLLGILALSWLQRRFWCRVLCPLGALLGTTALGGLLKLRQDGARCTSCELCTYHCQGAADPDQPGRWKASECFVCGNCTASCHRGGLAFGFEAPRVSSSLRSILRRRSRSARAINDESEATRVDPAGGAAPATRAASAGQPDLARRGLLAGLGLGLVSGPLALASPSAKRPPGVLIRPPGARIERDFLDRCIRCGECMKVCPQVGLHPAAIEAGLAGLWTPVLRPRLGYCEFHCTLCGQVCPTGAIQRLSPKEKETTVIGLAWIDTTRCLPFAYATPCIVCEEHCPTSPKAILLGDAVAISASGKSQAVRQPKIDPAKCIGCGICEYVCPVEGTAAVRIEGTGRTGGLGAFEGAYTQ